MDNITDLLSQYFKNQKMSQRDIAKQLGCSQPQVAQLLSGKANFGKKTATTWSEQFGFSISFLLTGEGSLFDSQKSDEESIMTSVAKESDEMLDPESVEYWKNRAIEAEKENQRLQGMVDAFQIALGVPSQKSNVG